VIIKDLAVRVGKIARNMGELLNLVIAYPNMEILCVSKIRHAIEAALVLDVIID